MQREYTDAGSIAVAAGIREKHADVAADVIDEAAYGHLIGNERVESTSGERMEAVDSTTGETLAEFQAGTAADVDRAVEAAQAGFEKWAKVSPQQRSAKLHEVADRLEERRTEIAIEQFRYLQTKTVKMNFGGLPKMG